MAHLLGNYAAAIGTTTTTNTGNETVTASRMYTVCFAGTVADVTDVGHVLSDRVADLR